ncbi:dipeptide ABC transporter ATP-binding protein [Fodinisporobacter ferrooxydans]|uniref:Dipeptide ABC transporter ATP-binding protein n=1 Tax=Fodinisporobacter ferrooxydans TaxID=2901836 RepID=A0ABY4CJM8_9BACL|nr:dipeptide ABC transporter ATP-binding protein [Alicyclobacillaceae bacterium MYW30-H2]
MTNHLLEVRHLKKYFPIKCGVMRRTIGHVKAVDDISFSIRRGETLGIVGESGCGKSTIGRLILRLLEPTAGRVRFEGTDLTSLSKSAMREMRQHLQMVFQDPYASLNPRMRIGSLIAEPLLVNKKASGKEAWKKAEELLEVVGLPQNAMKRYPHEFSGGQRQRVGIARALALHPKLIIADEAVSALDVSIQSQVLNLLKDLQNEYHVSYLFISHNLSAVRHISDRIGVMYLGRLVEIGDKKGLYANPLHPYTQALLSAVPVAKPNAKRERIILTGDVPSPVDPPQGCAFHPRCSKAMEICKRVRPDFIRINEAQSAACHLYA